MFLSRVGFGICLFLTCAGLCRAATPKEIDAAVRKGTGVLKGQYRDGRPEQVAARSGQGVGPVALAGLALLESGVAIDDPALKAITAAVRHASYTETQTYHIALCLLYLDRLAEPADVPLIQMLGVRLLAGQNARGGGTYTCIGQVSDAEERRLRATLILTELKAGDANLITEKKAGKHPGKVRAGVFGTLQPEVEKYAGRLATGRAPAEIDDNSNTQFGVLGIWVARKHGVPVEHALDLIETRFLATQNASGGWPYALRGEGSPSMTCAGLLGLATTIARREERRLKGESIRKDDLFAKRGPKEPVAPIPKSNDPFFNPPANLTPKESPQKEQVEPKKGGRKARGDVRDAAVQLALASLGRVVGQGKGRDRGAMMLLEDRGLGDRDYYFLWSLERVGVIYGLDKIGGTDWYDFGAEQLVRAQNPDGSWGGKGSGSNVETAFALLFLARSNLVRDLSSKVQKDSANAELRAGAGPAAADPAPEISPKVTVPRPKNPEVPSANAAPAPTKPATQSTPAAVEEDPKTIAAKLLGSTDGEWDKLLERVRDGRGSAYTQGLLLSIHDLKEARRKGARAALAERLARMTSETLRSMVKEKDAELRRGAVLAMAMKDDKAHTPDLIAALLDDEELVVRAARAGLKSLTDQDFGPASGANLAERTAAARLWLEWFRKQN